MMGRPLVLLDVDGVINDLGVADGQSRSYGIHELESNGFTLHIPDYMPELIQGLLAVADVWWCTTWLHDANAEVATHLGIDQLPVIEAGAGDGPDWKVEGSKELVTDALAAGGQVYWIEDFEGSPPSLDMPDGVVFIDTAVDRDGPVLRPADLADMLRVANERDRHVTRQRAPARGTKEPDGE